MDLLKSDQDKNKRSKSETAEKTSDTSAPKSVKVVMTAGPGGGKPRRWIGGTGAGLSKSYDFKPCCPTTVSAADAELLLGGGAELGGRVFVRAGTKSADAALEAGRPKSW